jgi:Glycosyl hydrolases family 39
MTATDKTCYATILSCNLAALPTKLPHCREHTAGSDHAGMPPRADWQEQLKKAHDELGFRHVRFRGALDDDVGTLICEKGNLVYSFFNSDEREEAQGFAASAHSLPLYYTEWYSPSDPRDSMHDDSYSPAFAIKTSLKASRRVQALQLLGSGEQHRIGARDTPRCFLQRGGSVGCCFGHSVRRRRPALQVSEA